MNVYEVRPVDAGWELRRRGGRVLGTYARRSSALELAEIVSRANPPSEVWLYEAGGGHRITVRHRDDPTSSEGAEPRALGAWRLDCRAYVFVTVDEPLEPGDWDALLSAVIEETERCSAASVVLPSQLPTHMGMAGELHRSLVGRLRRRGLDVVETG